MPRPVVVDQSISSISSITRCRISGNAGFQGPGDEHRGLTSWNAFGNLAACPSANTVIDRFTVFQPGPCLRLGKTVDAAGGTQFGYFNVLGIQEMHDHGFGACEYRGGRGQGRDREDQQWRLRADRCHRGSSQGYWAFSRIRGDYDNPAGVPAEERFEDFCGQRRGRRLHFRRGRRQAPRAAQRPRRSGR